MKRFGMFLVVMFLVVSVRAANADSTDPGVIVNKSDPEATTYDGSGPLMIAYSPTGFTLSFVYQGDPENPSPAPQLDSLTVDLTGVPTDENLVFQCYSDVWVNCETGALFSTINDGTVTYQFVFSDPTPGVGGTCDNSLPPAQSCPGYLNLGDMFTASLQVPEPSTLALLALGLSCLFAFAIYQNRRRHVLRTAA